MQITKGKLDCPPLWGWEGSVWSAGDLLGLLIAQPCPLIKVNVKVQQPNPGRMTKGTAPSGMVTAPKQETRPAEVLARRNEVWNAQ